MVKEIRLSAHCFIIRKCRNIWWLLICKMFGWIQISDLISDQSGWERKIKAKVECSVIGLCDGYWNCTLMEVYASSNRLSLHFDSDIGGMLVNNFRNSDVSRKCTLWDIFHNWINPIWPHSSDSELCCACFQFVWLPVFFHPMQWQPYGRSVCVMNIVILSTPLDWRESSPALVIQSKLKCHIYSFQLVNISVCLFLLVHWLN